MVTSASWAVKMSFSVGLSSSAEKIGGRAATMETALRTAVGEPRSAGKKDHVGSALSEPVVPALRGTRHVTARRLGHASVCVFRTAQRRYLSCNASHLLVGADHF